MSIITLTSDLGTKSQYAAVLQGVIYSIHEKVKVVEISNEIGNFDILEAAFIVKNTYPSFPKGTIHLLAIDPEFGENQAGVIVECEGHIFVAPDNGICSLITAHKPAQTYIIPPSLAASRYPKSFRIGHLLAPVAAMLSKGKPISELAQPGNIKELIWGEPTYSNQCLRGKIIHIDKFGNAITNIHKELFLSYKQDQSFEIFLRNIRLKRIVSTYTDVGKADALAIFGASQHLEVAMREASAADLLGLKAHDMITIEFK